MQRIRSSLFVCVVAVLGWAGPALAQDQLALAERAPDGDAQAEHAPGRYGGVTLGGEQAPPGARKRNSQVAVTWPGFQMRADGGSCVFLQSTAPLNVQPVKGQHKWTVDLGPARVEGTNRLPLETHYFNTPVTRVALKRSRQNTVLELSVRADVAPRVSQTHAKNGYHYLSLEFAPGSYLPAELAAARRTQVAPPPPSRMDQRPGMPPGDPADVSAALNAPPAAAGFAAGASADVRPGAPGRVSASDPSEAQAKAELEAQAAAAAAATAKMNAELEAELPPGMGPVQSRPQARGMSAGAEGRVRR